MLRQFVLLFVKNCKQKSWSINLRTGWHDQIQVQPLGAICNLRITTNYSSSDTYTIRWSRILAHSCCGIWSNVSPLFGFYPMIYCLKLIDRIYVEGWKKFVARANELVTFLLAYCSFWNDTSFSFAIFALNNFFSSLKNYDATFFLWVAANILLECQSRKKRVWNMNWNLCCLRTYLHSWSLCHQILLLYCA